MNRKDLSIIVMSCDKNKWLLDIFFDRFYKEWSNCPFEVNLVLENDNYVFNDRNIKVHNCFESNSFCYRLKKTLLKIKENYVLIFLDDFIIESPVNVFLLDKYLNIISENRLNNIILTPIEHVKNDPIIIDSLIVKRTRFGRYKACLQCGLWDRNILSDLLLEKENAWEFELFANIRSFVTRDKYYAVLAKDDKPFDYNDGFFLVQGKVNLEEKNRVEKKVNEVLIVNDERVFENKNAIIRDDVSMIFRIKRRIKIIVYFIIYWLRYIVNGENK